jgi:hypothetical protein
MDCELNEYHDVYKPNKNCLNVWQSFANISILDPFMSPVIFAAQWAIVPKLVISYISPAIFAAQWATVP